MTRESSQRYRIGITIFVNAVGELALFENGLRQNVLFLYQLFDASPRCEHVFLLNHGDAEPSNSEEETGIPADRIVRTHQVIDQLDFVISIGAALDHETVRELKQRGVPIISYKCGNGGVIAMEAMAADPPRGDAERYFDADYFDSIWMTPQHLHTYKRWCETLYRVPVLEVGQVWGAHFIEQRIRTARIDFGYSPKGEPWRVGVLDPNITVMKTSHMPMLVCEAAWRAKPAAFRSFYITNANRYADNPHFAGFHAALQSAQEGVMTLEQRFVGIDMIAEHCDAVVTHQWENGLNYLYYEVLYGGYPLVHNSPFLKDVGYYYPDFDAIGGGGVLVDAFARHDAELTAYRQAADRLIASVNPRSMEVIRRHEQLLLSTRRVRTS